MLFLYDKNDIALKGEGRGSLQDFLTEPQVTWNSSGFFELEFTYLIQGDLANHIVRDAYIKTTTKPDDDTYLSFTVYEVEPDYIENTIYVKAELTLLHELRDRVVPSNAYTGTAGAMMRNLKANLDRALDFEIVDNTTRQSYVEFEDTNAYEIIFGDSGIVEATGVEIDINERGFILRDVMGTVHQDELRESDYVSQLTINENHNDIVTRIIPTTVLMVDTAVRDGDRYTRETVETRVYGTPIVSSVVDDKDYRVRTQFVEYRNEQIEGEVKTYTYQREGETETLEMNYYLYEDVSQLNQDALGFFGVNSGIDEPNIELTIETLGLNPVENNYLQSLSKYDIVTVYLEDIHDSYKLYEVQVNETVYEPLVNQITKLGFTTESITLREATRNVNEGRVSSQRLQAELERQRQKDLEKRLRNYIYDARGRRMEFGSVLPDPDEYSNGDIYYLETADGSDIYELVDGAWEFKVGDKTGQIVEDAIREIQEQTDEIAEELETNIGRTDTLFEEWEDMKESFNYDELENSFINIVGNDGKWVYSNNRLHVEGQQTSDVSSNEVILTLEEGEKVLTHNGEGFSVGNDYTFSYANPTFVERPNSAVTVNFEPIPLHETLIGISPKHPQYPISARRVTSNNNLFNKIYHDDYTVTASSEWYQLAYKNVKIDKNQTVILPLIYKDGELTIEHNYVEISIEGVQLDGWRTQTRIEYVPFIREIVNDNSIYPEESYISQNGVTGQNTYEYQAEYVQGQFTGNIKDEKVIARIDPINEIFIQGTKTDTVPTSVVKFEFRDNSNLNVVHMGDSIIMGYGRQVKVPEVVEKTLQANSVINAGFGGTMANLHPNAEFAKISFVNLADSIASGNFSLQENMNLPGLNSSQRSAYMETAYRLRDVDWYETDALILSYGVNDWTDGTPIGTVNTKDKETYLGALKYGIDVIKAKYPHLQILLTQPIYWSDPSTGETIHTRTNSKGNKLTEFINALPQLGYPIAQTYDELGINDNNKSQYFDDNDGVHPNDNGNILLGTKIGRDFNQFITVSERPEPPVVPTETATVNFEFSEEPVQTATVNFEIRG